MRPHLSALRKIVASVVTLTTSLSLSLLAQPSTAAEACTVSTKLIPQCGALWGFYSAGNDTSATRAVETAMGRQFDIAKFYADFSSTSGNLVSPAQAQMAKEGRILHIAWESTVWHNNQATTLPAPDITVDGTKRYSWKFVASGKADAYLDAQAARIKAFGLPLFIDYSHEMDIADPANGTAADYVAAYRHLIERFDNAGATNAVWSIVYSGWQNKVGNEGFFKSFYPGDDVIDWIGWDPYNYDVDRWRDPSQLISSFYNLLDRADFGVNKPRMLGEFGSVNDLRRADWFRALPAALQLYPKLKAVQYFNSGSWAYFDTDSPSGQAFKEAGAQSYVQHLSDTPESTTSSTSTSTSTLTSTSTSTSTSTTLKPTTTTSTTMKPTTTTSTTLKPTTTTSTTAVPTPHGLLGQYFKYNDPTTPALTRTDANVNFVWSDGGPAAVGQQTYSVRWTGQVVMPLAGNYSFSTFSDDGVRLWIDGKLMIDHWDLHGTVRDASAEWLRAGNHTIKVEYFQAYGKATMQLRWTTPGATESVIPSSALLPATSLTRVKAPLYSVK